MLAIAQHAGKGQQSRGDRVSEMRIAQKNPVAIKISHQRRHHQTGLETGCQLVNVVVAPLVQPRRIEVWPKDRQPRQTTN
jgi:hypothetical protein